jgi:hypothetical protein
MPKLLLALLLATVAPIMAAPSTAAVAIAAQTDPAKLATRWAAIKINSSK